MLLSLTLGILVGIILGLTGAGGGILAVPALVVGMEWTVQQAAPVALIAVVGSALIGAIAGLRHKLVRYRAAFVIAAAGIPCTYLGISLAALLPHTWLMILFGLVMLIVASRLIKKDTSKGQQSFLSEEKMKDWDMGQLNPDTGRFNWNVATGFLMVAIGAFTGFMTGLLGVGGGFFIVPMLRRFTVLSMYAIVPTSLLIITLVGTGSIVVALMHGAHMPLVSTSLFALTTAIGMLIGRQLSHSLSEATTQKSFAVTLMFVAFGLEANAILHLISH